MRVWQKIVAAVLIGLLLGGGFGYLLIPGPEKGETKPLVAPGELDSHYAFLSGGKGGDIRVFAVPSMRLIRVIPVFNPSAQYGYARSANADTRQLLEKSGGELWGETLFPVLSKTNGDYDGKYLFTQDNAHARVALISLGYFETEKIAKVPNVDTAYGLTVDPDTKYVITTGKKKGAKGESIISFLDPHSLEVKFQVAGPEMTVVNGGFDGKQVLALAPGEKSLVSIDLKAAEEAVNKNQFQKLEGVPVIDGKKASNVMKLVKTEGTPTGITLTPDGKYAVVGSTSKKVTVIELASVKAVANPQLGSEPVQSTVDSKGNVYTSLKVDSQVIKWNLEKAIKGGDYVIERIEVHETPEYLEVMDARTKAPSDQWLLVYNQGGSDRFMDVGMDIQNVQVVDISGDKMKVVMDSPTEPDVLDGVAISATKVDPRDVFTPGKEAVKENKSRVVRTGPNSVEVFLTAKRAEFGMDSFKVKQGDKVKITITNIERTKDIIHGFAITEYDVNAQLPPGKTAVLEFVADKPGVFPYYCTIFCSALHMEMQGKMIVEPRQ